MATDNTMQTDLTSFLQPQASISSHEDSSTIIDINDLFLDRPNMSTVSDAVPTQVESPNDQQPVIFDFSVYNSDLSDLAKATQKTHSNTPNRKRKQTDDITSSKHFNTSHTPPDILTKQARTVIPLDIEVILSSEETEVKRKEVRFTPPKSSKPNSLTTASPTTSHSSPFSTKELSHALLVKLRETGKAPLPTPVAFQDTWDSMHVRMPCSVKNLLHQQAPGAKKQLLNKWAFIQSSLQSRISNSWDLQEAILRYNSEAGRKWDFSGLHAFFKHYTRAEVRKELFETTIPDMARLALSLPTLVTAPIPLLRCDHVRDLTLSQIQIACLLANAFFCTFPRRNASGFNSEYGNFPSINFHTLFASDQICVINKSEDNIPLSKCKANKLRCIFHYFKRVLSDQPAGCVTFRRQQLEQPFDWSLNNSTPTQLKIDNEGRIEDTSETALKVDFANKKIGGGVLSGGCVQEEIYFLICPEMIVSRLFTECLQPHEALVMIGPERFSDYSGYSDSFEWSGDHNDITAVDSLGRHKTYVTAIDAMVIHKSTDQFRPFALRRELDKALAGFMSGEYDSDNCLPAATGHWGCGAFGGDKSLKAVLQLMCAAVTKRNVIYYTFGDVELGDRLVELHQKLLESGATVSQLWTQLCKYHLLLNDKEEKQKAPSLFTSLIAELSSHSP